MVSNNTESSYAIDIPNKKYFLIGEVVKMCGVKAHVLRYWEGQFSQLKPSKRKGRRYYQREDVLLVMEIDDLLNNQGFTVSGAIARLNDKKHGSIPCSVLENTDNEQQLPLQNLDVHALSDLDLIEMAQALRTMLQDCQTFQKRVNEEL